MKCIIVFCCLSCFIHTSCTINNGDYEGIAQKQFRYQSSPNSENPSKIQLIIDRSGSMRGYVGTESFKELIRSTVHSLGPYANVSYAMFDTSSKEVSKFTELFNREEYHGYAADFNKAFAKRRNDPSSIMIMITDLQINNDDYYADLVDIFQTEIARGGYMKMFSANPNFDGTIYKQYMNQIDTFHYSGQRPIYAITVGERKYAMFIDAVLKQAIRWEYSLTLSNNGPVEIRTFFSQPADMVGAMYEGNVVYRHTTHLRHDEVENLTFKSRIISPRVSEWGNWDATDLICENYVYDDRDTTFKVGSQQLGIERIRQKGDTLTLECTIKNANPKPTTLWRVFLRPYIENIPDWIEKQSCIVNGDQARKTLFLKDFIKHVIRPVSDPFTIATVHVYLSEK